MKKNRMMRLASGLLVAVLLSTCTISGTFAKYVTSETASDSARVAKWGVFFDLEGGPLFSTQYAKDDTSDDYTAMTTTVKADAKVVAPGTEGEAITLRTTGVPEVSYVVTFDVDDNNWETIFTNSAVTYDAYRNPTATVITDGYYPVEFTLTLNGTPSTYTDMDDLKDAIEEFTYYYDVGINQYVVDGSNQSTAPELELTWKWDFHTSKENDVKDTTLGNLAAEVPGVATAVGTDGTDYNLEVKLGVTATATQID